MRRGKSLVTLLAVRRETLASRSGSPLIGLNGYHARRCVVGSLPIIAHGANPRPIPLRAIKQHKTLEIKHGKTKN